MLPKNLGHVFDGPLRLTPDAVAVIQDDTTLSYRELEGRAGRMANVLTGLGVGPGDRGGLMFGNDWRFLEAFFAPMRLGAVSVPRSTPAVVGEPLRPSDGLRPVGAARSSAPPARA